MLTGRAACAVKWVDYSVADQIVSTIRCQFAVLSETLGLKWMHLAHAPASPGHDT